MNKQVRKIASFLMLIVVLVSLLINFNSSQVFADYQINFDPSLIQVSLDPGARYNGDLTVSLQANENPVDMTVEIKGLGTSPEGSVIGLSSQEDQSAYSARSYITNLSVTTLRLEPYKPQKVNFTIQVPTNAAAGEKYGLITVTSNAYGTGVGAAARASLMLPIIVNVADVTIQPVGKIANVQVTQAVPGKILQLKTTLLNTGSTRIPAQTTKNIVVVKDQNGMVVGQTEVELSSPSIIPTFNRIFVAQPGPATGLNPGKYTAESRVILSDGTVLDTSSISFDVALQASQNSSWESYLQPGMDSESVVSATNVNGDAVFSLNAVAKAGVMVVTSGARGNGTLTAAGYLNPPVVTPYFYGSIGEGGTGKKPIKYVNVRAEGFTQGSARVTVYFNTAEVDGYDLDTLFLAYFDGSIWNPMTNTSIDKVGNSVSGDVQLLNLDGTVIGLGGDAKQLIVSPVVNDNLANTDSPANNIFADPVKESSVLPEIPGVSWSLLMIIIGSIVLIGGISAFLLLRKTPQTKGNRK